MHRSFLHAVCVCTLGAPALGQDTVLPRLPDWWTVGAEALWEIDSVTSGGVRRRTSSRHLLMVHSSMDLAAALDRPGAGTLEGSFQSAPAATGGSADIGDIQVASNIETDVTLDHVLELWYAAELGGGVSLEAGKIDANRRFAVPHCAGGFTHSSAGFSPTILVMPSYPDPATAVNLFLEREPEDDLRVRASYGLFDGAFGVDGVRTGRRGPSTFFSDDRSGDTFHVAQLDVEAGEVGATGWARVGLGAWYHDGDFVDHDGGTDRGTGGPFAIAEWAPAALEGWTVFAQFGSADRNLGEFGAHYALGLTGTVDGVAGDRDTAGLYWSAVDVPGAVAPSDEVSFDLFYRAQISGSFWVQPEVFWFIDPGGRTDIGDATALFLRVGLSL